MSYSSTRVRAGGLQWGVLWPASTICSSEGHRERRPPLRSDLSVTHVETSLAALVRRTSCRSSAASSLGSTLNLKCSPRDLPAMRDEAVESLRALNEVVQRLRLPGGCPGGGR